jgi:hypothetical protein
MKIITRAEAPGPKGSSATSTAVHASMDTCQSDTSARLRYASSAATPGIDRSMPPTRTIAPRVTGNSASGGATRLTASGTGNSAANGTPTTGLKARLAGQSSASGDALRHTTRTGAPSMLYRIPSAGRWARCRPAAHPGCAETCIGPEGRTQSAVTRMAAEASTFDPVHHTRGRANVAKQSTRASTSTLSKGPGQLGQSERPSPSQGAEALGSGWFKFFEPKLLACLRSFTPRDARS